MTKEECIALLKRYADYDGMGIPNLVGCKEAMRMAAELLEQPSLSSNLDEAAEIGWDAYYNSDKFPSNPCAQSGYKVGFKAGVEWQKEQDDKLVDIIYQQGIEKGKDEMKETLKKKEK